MNIQRARLERNQTHKLPRIVADATYPGIWRIQWPDGRLSDMANRTRANDAAACFIETAERRQRGRQSPPEAPPMRLNEQGHAA